MNFAKLIENRLIVTIIKWLIYNFALIAFVMAFKASGLEGWESIPIFVISVAGMIFDLILIKQYRMVQALSFAISFIIAFALVSFVPFFKPGFHFDTSTITIQWLYSGLIIYNVLMGLISWLVDAINWVTSPR